MRHKEDDSYHALRKALKKAERDVSRLEKKRQHVLNQLSDAQTLYEKLSDRFSKLQEIAEKTLEGIPEKMPRSKKPSTKSTDASQPQG